MKKAEIECENGEKVTWKNTKLQDSAHIPHTDTFYELIRYWKYKQLRRIESYLQGKNIWLNFFVSYR